MRLLKHLDAFYVQQILKVSIQAIKKRNIHTYVCATRTGCPSSLSLSLFLSLSQARIPRRGGRRKRHINGLLQSCDRNGDFFCVEVQRLNFFNHQTSSSIILLDFYLLKTWKWSVGKTKLNIYIYIFILLRTFNFLDFSRKHLSFTWKKNSHRFKWLAISHCHCCNYALHCTFNRPLSFFLC